MERDRPGAPAPVDHTTTESAIAPDAEPEAPGEAPMVPREAYEIRGERARGGLGRVLEANDRRLGRVVAIKELLLDTLAAQRRFSREARLTARLQHPSIVPVYEAGVWPTGELFYAMKLVEGRSLKELVAEKPTLNDRLALLPNVIAVAEAMAYAHSLRVIHRDLKPSNVVIGAFGETMVVDWGLAKDLDRKDDDPDDPLAPQGAVGETVVGTVLGTPAYMPPEQAAGQAVTEAADVYALGSILYHVLAGRPPYAGKSSAMILERVLADPPPPLAQVEPAIPRDLLTIVEKAMARDPAHRYRDARAFAEDLSRFQTGQLVTVHRYSRWALFARWVRRYRLPLAVATFFLVVLAGTAVVSVNRILAERNRARERSAALTLAQARTALERDPTETIAWLKQYPLDGADWEAVHAIAADAASRGIAHHVLRSGSAVQQVAFSPDSRSLATGSWDGRVRVFDEAGRGREVARHGDWVDVVAFSPDGRLLASADKDGKVLLTDLASGQRRELAAKPGRFRRVQFDRDGTHLVASAEGIERGGGGAWRWDLASGARTDIGSDLVADTDLAPDGRSVAIGSVQGGVAIWSEATGEARLLGQNEGYVPTIRWSPRGDAVVTASWDRTIRLWPVDGRPGQTLATHKAQVHALAVSPDGRHVASSDARGVVKLVDTVTGTVQDFAGHTQEVHQLAFSPDGTRLASGSSDKTVRLWEVSTGQSAVLRQHLDGVYALAFSPDGKLLATAGREGQVRVWRLAPPVGHRLASHQGGLTDFAALGGALVVSAGRDRAVRIWDTDTLQATDLAILDVAAAKLGVSPDGKRVAVGDWKGILQLWDVAGKAKLWSTEPLYPAADILFAPADTSIVHYADSGVTHVIDGNTGAIRAKLERTHGGSGWRATRSADGRWVATTAFDRPPELWDVASGASHLLDVEGRDFVQALAFAPDSSVLAFAASDGAIVLWDATTQAPRTILSYGGEPLAVAFSPDGARLAASGIGPVTIWELSSGATRVLGESDRVVGLTFAPDGKRLAAVGESQATVILWDLESGRKRIFRGHDKDPSEIVFVADGKRLVSGSDDGALYVWDNDLGDLPRVPGELRSWFERTTTAVVTPGGAALTP